MTTSSVSTHARFNVRSGRLCPVCGGGSDSPSGHGVRCYGFLSDDGAYAHCTREEHAGDLPLDGADTYAHRLNGPCRCGATHGDAPAPRPVVQTRPRVVATYDYIAGGELRHQTVRYEPKSFRQRRPSGAGGWEWNLAGIETVLYRLPELIAAEPAD